MDDVLAGTMVFTGERSRAGYRVNRMAMTLTDAGKRADFVADEQGYMRGMGLTDAEIDMVRRRDWKSMLEAGSSIYLLIKIAGAVGQTLQQVGAHTAGMTVEEYLAKRQRH
jgi:protocatechuate 4,5-dioxygenase alpha chain